MQHFVKIRSGIDVAPLLAQIEAHPELWDQRRERTSPESPHHGVSDLWVRYRAPVELKEPKDFAEPHFAVFYPAWSVLSAIKPIVFDLMARVEAVHLGGILITKIPAGGQVKPHHDRGGWHAEFFTTKVYVGLKSNPQCINRCENEEIVIGAGDAVIFNNLLTHSVENNGPTDRITAIICFRTE